MMKITRLAVVMLTTLLCYTGVAQAQWIFLGRKTLGVINSLTNQGREKEGQGYDVVTVLLEADADKVYGTTVDLLKESPNVTINYREGSGRVIFAEDKVLIGMKVSEIEDHFSQLLISSVVTSGNPGNTSFVVEKVLQICEKMAVHCTVAKD